MIARAGEGGGGVWAHIPQLHDHNTTVNVTEKCGNVRSVRVP